MRAGQGFDDKKRGGLHEQTVPQTTDKARDFAGFVRSLAFPLAGKVSPKVTDEGKNSRNYIFSPRE